MRDGRFRDEKCPGNLIRRESSKKTQRERHSRFFRKHRMTRDQNEAQELVVNVLVDIHFNFRMVSRCVGCGVALDAPMGPIQHPTPAELVDGPVLCSRHEPRTRIVRNTGVRPTLECREQRFLSEILGKADVAHYANETTEQPSRLHPPDRFDGLSG